MEGKKSFLLYCDVKHTVDKLSNDKAGELFKHILSYVNDENPITDDFVIEIAFEPIKQALKRDLQKWNNEKKSRSEAGKKGMENRWNKEKNEITNISNNNTVKECLTPVTNITDNVNVIVNDIVNVKKDKREFFKIPTMQEIKEYCLNRKNNVDPEKFINYYISNGWMVGRNKMKDWQAAIRTWEKNNKSSIEFKEPPVKTYRQL